MLSTMGCTISTMGLTISCSCRRRAAPAELDEDENPDDLVGDINPSQRVTWFQGEALTPRSGRKVKRTHSDDL